MQVCRPKVLLDRPRPGCKVTVVLIDWGVRESFHSLDYLNRQTADRSSYELIWLEFYDGEPKGLRRAVERGGPDGPALDKQLVAGHPKDYLYSKHRLYNIGILAAEGEICVFCDSDAILTPTFIEKVIAAFADDPRTALHLDEVRSNDPRFYPFRYPSIEEVRTSEFCYNWRGTVSKGLDNSPDMLHHANYGACMAARRDDLIAIGGADEHLDFLGYVCGPYEMTFRLVNHGLKERWLRDEYLYHTWHPNLNGENTEYHGPHDGRFMSLMALEARAVGRVRPHLENAWIGRARNGQRLGLDELARLVAERDEPTWRADRLPTSWDGVFWFERDFEGFNLYCYRERWYGLPVGDGSFEPEKARRHRVLIEADSHEQARREVLYYNQLPKQLWDRLWVKPLHLLPLRVMLKLRKELARLT